MRELDPLVSYQLLSEVCELGKAFSLTVSRAPVDGAVNKTGIGKVRSVRVHLGYETEGQGDSDRKNVFSFEIPIDRFGMCSADVAVQVPDHAPISYEGNLFQIRYAITIRTDISAKKDFGIKVPVVVVPYGGAGLYQAAHPVARS